MRLIFLQVLGAYLEYMTQTGVLLGGEENDTRSQMLDVIEFERQLANVSRRTKASGQHDFIFIWSFYGPVKIVEVMLSQSVNLFTLFWSGLVL